MDPTRISIARILALDVPLTWQDAVAVAQEAAMLSDVNAAMNSRPSLVSPETCFITRAGDLELPDATDVESPEAVADLLRAMLGDADVPEALEALAYGPSTRDLSSDLAAFPVGNRRAVIARLATRAIAALTAPMPRMDAAPPPAAVVPRAPVPIPFPAPPAQIPPPFVAARPAVVVQPPPFVATPAAAPVVAAAPAAVPPPDAADHAETRRLGPAPPASDVELRRLRSRAVERERRNQRLFARLVGWLAWRPDSPDPRVLGGAAVVVAALVSVVWRSQPAPVAPNREARATAPAVAAPAAPATPAPSTAFRPTAAGAQPAADAGRTGSSRVASTATAGPGRPRDAERVTDDTRRPTEPSSAGAVPAPAPPVAPPIVIPAPPATSATGTASDGRRAAASPAIPRGGRGRPTLYSANDADVAPPVMLRQQLPSSLLDPDSEVPDDWPYLELLIDEQGAVERVRLRAKTPAPGQTLYRHRMLIAAAKAWQFEPAQLNGQPVRYVMRVPLEP